MHLAAATSRPSSICPEQKGRILGQPQAPIPWIPPRIGIGLGTTAKKFGLSIINIYSILVWGSRGQTRSRVSRPEIITTTNTDPDALEILHFLFFIGVVHPDKLRK